jgi:transposase
MIDRLLGRYEEQVQQADSMSGWGRRAAQDAVAETGVDMSRFPTGAHLASWPAAARWTTSPASAPGAPNPRRATGTWPACSARPPWPPAAPRPAKAPLPALARRRGKLKAQVAIGNTQLKVYHKLLSSPGMRYEDLGLDYYECRRDVRRQIAHHVDKLGDLGFEVTLCRRPESAGSASTQAA